MAITLKYKSTMMYKNRHMITIWIFYQLILTINKIEVRLYIKCTRPGLNVTGEMGHQQISFREYIKG